MKITTRISNVRKKLLVNLGIFLPVAIMKILFFISYPLNISGDGFNYYVKMLLPRQGFLVHADGYPYLWGFFLYACCDHLITSPVKFELLFVLFQHLFNLGTLVLFYIILHRYIGQGAAIISLYFLGLSVFYLSAVSTATPVWFQSDLWVLFVIMLILGLQNTHLGKKTGFYVLSVVIFLVSYLVKYNSLILVIFYIPVLLIEIHKKTTIYFIAGLINGSFIAGVIFFMYLFRYHYPTTGTYDLHYDSGWVLIVRTNSLLSVSNGINTKRLFALNAILPDKFNYEKYFVDMWKHVNEVPWSERRVYNEEYERIIEMDEMQLDTFLSNNPPRTTSYYYEYVLRIQYYVGLKEGDELGKHAAYEAISSNPLKYFEEVLAQTIRIQPQNWNPLYLPNFDELTNVARLHKKGRFAYYYFEVPYYDWNQPFRTNQETSWFWKPGVRLLNALSFRMEYYTIGIIAVGVLLVLFNQIYKKDRRHSSFVLLWLIFFIVIFKVASNMVLIFRANELRTVFPFIGVCVGLSVNMIFNELLSLLRQFDTGKDRMYKKT